jgi:CHAD domain-containing protein
MHFDLKRLKALFRSTHPSLLVEAFDERRRALDARLLRARAKPSEKRIHALRVAARRMLSTLDLAETVLPPKRTRKLRRTIRRQLRDLRFVRDIQVQLGYCDRMASDFPQLAAFRTDLRRREKRMRRKVGRKLADCDPARLRKRTGRALGRLIDALSPSDDAALGRGIHASIGDSYGKVLYLRARVDPKQPETIHRMRLAFKRFRYMAEIAAPALPHLGRDRLRAMHDYQDRMGAIQDSEMLLRSMMDFRRRSGRTSLLVVENEIRRRRQRLIGEFMQTIDELRFFWSQAETESREVG